jgi:hypothetical protein
MLDVGSQSAASESLSLPHLPLGAFLLMSTHVLSFLTFVLLHPTLVCHDVCALSVVARIHVLGEQGSASTTLGVRKVVPFGAGVAHVQSVLEWN